MQLESRYHRNRSDVHWGDRLFAWGVTLAAFGTAFLLFFIGFFLYRSASPAIQKFGMGFFVSSVWDPVQEVFGAFPVIYGTVVSSALGILIAAPLSIGVALFLNELAPKRAANVMGFLIDMLAAIPSVVFGLWGVFVLAPFLRREIEPILTQTLGRVPLLGELFSGPPYGVGMLAAGLILAIMITPTITSISREVFRAIPRMQRESALALGATRWEMMKLSVLQGAKQGVFGAIMLGLGRALGETMAVTMLIGNRSHVSASLFSPGQTMASLIANEYAEATSDLHVAALIEVGLALFAVTFVMNFIARFLVWRTQGGKFW